jgi:hypothetical protein
MLYLRTTVPVSLSSHSIRIPCQAPLTLEDPTSTTSALHLVLISQVHRGPVWVRDIPCKFPRPSAWGLVDENGFSSLRELLLPLTYDLPFRA